MEKLTFSLDSSQVVIVRVLRFLVKFFFFFFEGRAIILILIRDKLIKICKYLILDKGSMRICFSNFEFPLYWIFLKKKKKTFLENFSAKVFHEIAVFKSKKRCKRFAPSNFH